MPVPVPPGTSSSAPAKAARRLVRWRGTGGFFGDRAGSVAIMTGFFFFVMMGLLAIAIDMASLYLERRSLQGVADIAAVAGASDIARAEEAVAATLAANQVDARYTIVRGRYVADPQIDHTQRFAANATPYNAVQVSLEKAGRLYFAKVFNAQTATLGVRSLAANSELAAFSVGSRLLALRDGVANQLLGKLLGTRVELTVMDYQGLASADVQVARMMDAVASQIDLKAGTFQDVLDASVTAGDLVAAMAKVTGESGDAAANLALKRLLLGGGLGAKVPLSSLIDLGPFSTVAIGDPAPGFDARVSAMQILSSSAILANGKRQVQIDLGAEVPGLLGLKVDLAIGEMPQHTAMIAIGPNSTRVRTAQARLRIVASMGGQGLLKNLSVNLPLVLDLAHAQAQLASMACSSSGPSRVTVAARPGIAEAWIGELRDADLNDFSRTPQLARAKIIDASLIRVDGRAHVTAGNLAETRLNFTGLDIERGTVKRVSTNSVISSLVSTLVGNLDMEVQVVTLGLVLPGPLLAAVGDLLGTVAEPLDAVVYGVLSTLGLHLGEADIRVHGAHCGGGMLAG
jgi:uncharacterized membrane protein